MYHEIDFNRGGFFGCRHHRPGFLRTLLLTLALLPGFTPAGRATITALNYWRQGENDPGAHPGVVASATTDSVGTNPLTMVGSSLYSGNIATAAATATGSSLDTSFFANGVYGIGTLIPATLLNNFGVELWVNPASTSGSQALAYNGSPGSSGWGLFLINGTYQGLFGGVTFIGTATATAGTWTHLALVRNNGTTTLYVNGVASGSTSTAAPNPPTGNFGFGINPNGGGNQFLGYMDEMRIFTFTANQFSTSDLLINAGAPLATVGAATSITATSAILNGSVNPNGLDSVSYFAYGSGTYGTLTPNQKAAAAKSSGAVSAAITGLAPGTSYQYLVVAANSAGQISSSGTTFTTLAVVPVATTGQAAPVTGTGATLKGTVNPNGAATTAYFQYGLTASSTVPSLPNGSFEADTYTVYPGYASGNGGGITGWTLSDPSRIGINPAGSSPFADNGAIPDGANVAFIQSSGVNAVTLATTITGLVVGQTYLVSFLANSRSGFAAPMAAWSVNGGNYVPITAAPAVGGSQGYYSNTGFFVATAATAALVLRNQTNADSTVLVDAFNVYQIGGGATVPVALAATNVALPVASAVTSLAPGTLYHFRQVAVNSQGTTTGNDQVFTTAGGPVITSATASNLTTSNGVLQAVVFPGQSSTTVYFNYGLSTDYGFTTGATNIGAGSSSVSGAALADNLFAGLPYHFQVVAANSSGTAVSPDFTFTAPGNLSATVTTTNDNLSAGSLRQAIANATNGGTINFAVTGTITLTNALPAIFKGLTINGPGAGNLTISGNNLYRIFFVDAGTNTVNVNNLTLANGKAQGGAGGGSYGGGGLGAGGALFVNSGSVIASNLNFTGNSAVGGNGASSAGGGTGGGGGGFGGAGGTSSGAGGGGGGGFAGNGGTKLETGTGGGGGGGFGASGGQGRFDAGAGGGALLAGQDGSVGVGGTGGAGGGGTGANNVGPQGTATGGSGILFGGGGGGGYGIFGAQSGGYGGNGGKFGGGGGGGYYGPGGAGGDFGGGGGSGLNYFNGYGGGGSGGFGGGGGGDWEFGGNGGFGGGGGGAIHYGGMAGAFAGYGNANGGGGGSALGGAAFVRAANGASITIYNASMDAGLLTGGGSASQAGQTAGSSLFSLGGTNVITVGSGTNIIAGSIAEYGPAALAKNGAGTLVLSGASSYSGPTWINGGTLTVAGNISSSSALYITNGATLGGGGTVGAVNLNTGGTLSPGLGTLTTGNATWAGVANYNWQIYDATNAEGLGYGTIKVNGSLDLSAVTTLDLNLWSFANGAPATNGNPIHFPSLAGGSWTLIQTSGGITGFNANKCVVNKAATNGTGGFTSGLAQVTFIASVTGSKLVLTPVAAPFLLGQPVTEITSLNALLNAQVNPYNTNAVLICLSGLTTNYGTTNLISLGAGGAPVAVTNRLTGLVAATMYHYRMIATNAAGLADSGDQTFITPAGPPVAVTLGATSPGSNTVSVYGTVNPENAAGGWFFQYGLTTNYGLVTSPNALASGSVPVRVTNSLAGLDPGTLYHFQLVATNGLGTRGGGDLTFTSPASLPALGQQPPSGIGRSNATLNVLVTPNDVATTVFFSWGATTNYGMTNALVVGSGTDVLPVADALTNLATYTLYHYQVTAINSAGATTGSDQTFYTLAPAVNGPLSPVAYWHMGESDPGAAAGTLAASTRDEFGSNTLTLNGNGAYYAAQVSANAAGLAGSRLSLNFFLLSAVA